MDREHLHRNYWNARVSREKKRDRYPEKRIHTDLVWLEIEPYVQPGSRILDAGGGYGRYSVPLAQRGCMVTHLEPAERMLSEARTKAKRLKLESLTFLRGKVQDLSRFDNRSYDLVLALDAPVSYAYPQHGKALIELCRVSRKTLAVSVVNRVGQLPVVLESELRWSSALNLSKKLLETGDWDHPAIIESFEHRIPYLSRFLFPPLHAFAPRELVDGLAEQGFTIRRLAATGTLARLLSRKTLFNILRHPDLYREFLHMSYLYDAQIEVLGIGARSAAGLLAVAERVEE